MKPIRLEMSAFGPYADKQVLDFSLLEGRNIFLVTGVTGAGKTTIFDAISYALFGEPSGSSRETSSLRSHFASDDVQTYVDLTFEVKGEQYQIIRSPEQEVPRKRGEGTTIKGASVELILPKGEKPLTKVGEVQERIREIVGVDKDQFRQIVMLPQGEFRRLLESKSSDREAIFRKIFGTYAFQNIQLKLRERRSKLAEDLRLDRNSVSIYIQNLKSPEEHPLRSLQAQGDIDTNQVRELALALMAEDHQKVQEDTKSLEGLRAKADKAKQELAMAAEINQKLDEAKKAEVSLAMHLEQQEEMTTRKMHISLAKKALEVRRIDDLAKENAKHKVQRCEALEAAQSKEQVAKAQLEEVSRALQMAKGEESKRQALRDEIAYLMPYKEKIALYHQKVIKVNELQKNLQTLTLQKNQDEAQLQQFKKELETILFAMAEGAKAETNQAKLQMQQDEKTRLRQELLELHKNNQSYLQMATDYEMQKQSFTEADQNFKTSRTRYETLEDLFRKGQAGLLAELLEEGTPCPVCGSCEHPHKTPKIQGMPSEMELKAAKLEKEAHEKAYLEVLQELGQQKSRLEDLEQNVLKVQAEKLKVVLGDYYEQLESVDEQQKHIVACGSELRVSLDTIKAEKEVQSQLIQKGQKAAQDKERCEVGIKDKEQAIKTAQDTLTQITGELASAGQVVQQIEGELPEGLRTSDALDEKIRILEEALRMQLTRLETLQESEKEKKAAWAAGQKDNQNKKEEYELAQSVYEESMGQLEQALKLHGFASYDAYKQAYKSQEEVMREEECVHAYEQQLATLRALREKLQENAKDLKYVDLVQLEEVSRVIEEQVTHLGDGVNQTKARMSHNQEQLQVIEVTSHKIRGKEEEYSIVAELENVAYGDTVNKKRMTFESYVLTAYFDEIIEAANHRLEKMSSGRFELRRKEDLAKGRGKQGLELEVLDYHTGKARDVKTLSGGEGFKASLALALGLADVIQSHAGGISIETMFVDEGFGTLDAASLDSAIECLLGLQQGGRLIGIISHVAELRERIEVALEVSAGLKGSKAEFVI